MLAFEPESLDHLRARYQAALVDIYSRALGLGHEDLDPQRSGLQRKHVFDCKDGIRLIIGREQVGSNAPILHISASANQGSPLHSFIVAGHINPADFTKKVARRFYEISGDDRIFGKPYFSERGIPHWMFHEAGQHSL